MTKRLMRLFRVPSLPFAAFIRSHEDQERTSRMRVILCPREIGRNTRAGQRGDGRTLSRRCIRSSVNGKRNVIHTRAHTLTIATGGDSGRSFCATTEKEKAGRGERRQLREWAPTGREWDPRLLGTGENGAGKKGS